MKYLILLLLLGCGGKSDTKDILKYDKMMSDSLVIPEEQK